MQYSEEQVSRAKSTDLVLFLQSQGEKLIKSGKEYRWMAHDSVTVRGNCWFRHSRGTGGGPIDFVMEFYGLTFPEAMKKLTGEEGEERREAKGCRGEAAGFTVEKGTGKAGGTEPGFKYRPYSV